MPTSCTGSKSFNCRIFYLPKAESYKGKHACQKRSSPGQRIALLDSLSEYQANRNIRKEKKHKSADLQKHHAVTE
jgi:hypothetical protein